MDNIIQIADTTHGTIYISSLEKEIISTQAFNRLHNILQNSTVYLTFPSNQTKRFSHSLGAMHLSGKIFFHSIVDSSDEVIDEFFNNIIQEIEGLKGNKEFTKALRLALTDDYINVLESYNNISVTDPLYRLATPSLLDNKYLFVYTLIYQSIRLAALLHDIGHPPFSHVTENALKRVWNKLDGNITTERQQYFIETTQHYFENDFELHEEIGNLISDRLINSLIITPRSQDEAKYQLFIWLVNHFVNLILEEKGKLYEDIHRIIASAIDCDRLDYVSRDLESSGFSHGKIEYDRLISSMSLVKYNNDFLFCTDIKTLNTVEDYFNRRWLLYKNVIFHHRVIKTDYLLENVIVELSMDYLAGEEKEEDNNVLPINISGLWRAIKEDYSNQNYFNDLMQWDDSYLITILRQHYFSYYKDTDELVRFQLEEILSNRKRYRSMVKKMEAFWEIDKATAKAFSLDFDILKGSLGSYIHRSVMELHGNNDLKAHKAFETMNGKVQMLLEKLKNIKCTYENNDVELEGFFLTELKRLIEILTGQKNLFTDVIDNTVKAIATTKYNAKDCLVVFKSPKTGLEKNFPFIRNKDKTEILSKFSRIHTHLKLNISVFPTFFIYVYEADGRIKHQEFLEDVGREISQPLEALIKELIP